MKVWYLEKQEVQGINCDFCKKRIENTLMWRAFLNGVVIENCNSESLDFCSKKCSLAWIKENFTTEKIETDTVKNYKKDLEGEYDGN